MSEHLSLTAMREELRRSQKELLAALNQADSTSLHHLASEGVWSLAQVIAHISEARRFFIAEVLRVASSPGTRMGRTMNHPARLAAVETHAQDSSEQLGNALVASHAELMAGLDKLDDAALDIPGEHVKFGHQTLREFIAHFIVEHDQKHVQQAQRCLAQAKAA